MNELNKAELRRLAENAEGSFGQFDPSESEQELMARITPTAVLSLLDECDRLQATCEGLDRQNDAIAEEIGKVAAERDAALAGLASHRASRMAYASEFAPDAEGDHDVGSIHENIRKLKAELEAYKSQLRALIHISDATGWERHSCGEIEKARKLMEQSK